MRFRLTPQETSFYELFSRAAQNLMRGTELLNELALPGVDVQSVSDRLTDVEHDSDQITHDLYKKINSTFITPFDREDIHGLASALDDCMDMMDAAVDLIVLYRIGELPSGVSDQVEVLSRMAELTADAMPRLRSMRDLTEYWIEINRLENHADQTYRRLLAELFNDGTTDAIDVMKHKEVIEELEAAADAFESVANKVESIAVKES